MKKIITVVSKVVQIFELDTEKNELKLLSEDIQEISGMRRKKQWTKEECIDELDRYIKKYGVAPKTKDIILDDRLATLSVFKRCTGQTYSEYIKQSYYELFAASRNERYDKYWAELDKTYVLNLLESFIRSNKRAPTMTEMNKRNGLPSYSAFRKITGQTPSEYIRDKYPDIVKYGTRANPWTEPLIKEVVDDFLKKHNRLPELSDCKWTSGLPSRNTFMNVLGISFKEFMRMQYTSLCDGHEYLTEAGIKAAISHFKQENGKYPIISEFQNKNGLPSPTEVRNTMGITLRQFLTIHYSDLPQGIQTYWTEARIRKAVDAFVKRYDRLPNIKDFNINKSLPSYATFMRYTELGPIQLCKSWYPELAAKVGKRGSKWTPEKLGEAVDNFVNTHGRIPKHCEVNKSNHLPSGATFYSIVGISALQYCKERYPDIVGRGY